MEQPYSVTAVRHWRDGSVGRISEVLSLDPGAPLKELDVTQHCWEPGQEDLRDLLYSCLAPVSVCALVLFLLQFIWLPIPGCTPPFLGGLGARSWK